MQGHAACAQLVQNGGVAQLLSQRGSYIQAEPAVDSNAVRDSLECLAGIAAASPEGARACLESEATQAASMVLQVLQSLAFSGRCTARPAAFFPVIPWPGVDRLAQLDPRLESVGQPAWPSRSQAVIGLYRDCAKQLGVHCRRREHARTSISRRSQCGCCTRCWNRLPILLRRL